MAASTAPAILRAAERPRRSRPVRARRGPGSLAAFGAERLAVVVVVLAVAMLPLLQPKGPGNTTVVDLLMAIGIVAVVVWAGAARARLHLPYVTPVALLVIAGSTAALLNGSARSGGQAVMQEIFLLAWCGAVTTLCRSDRVLRAVARAWCLSSTCWAGFMVLALWAGRDDLAGLHRADGGRAELTFDHPNLAGNYFMASFFIVLATRCPAHPLARAVSCATLLAAMLYAGSNTALLGLGVGITVMLFIHVRRRSDLVAAVAAVLCLAICGGLAWTFVAEPVLSTIGSSENRIVRYSVARTSRSANNREALFASQFELYQQSNVVGIGPAATRSALGEAEASKAKEAHSDYIASLVERGPLGVIGLVALFGAVGVRAISVNSAPRPRSRDPALPNVGALSGVLVAFAIAGITHEVLHYRHLWTLLAILAAQYLLIRRDGKATGTTRAGRPVRTAFAPDGS